MIYAATIESHLKLISYDALRAQQSAEFYRIRIEAIQQWQATIPEPYRTEVCDILANGKIAPRNRRPEAEGEKP